MSSILEEWEKKEKKEKEEMWKELKKPKTKKEEKRLKNLMQEIKDAANGDNFASELLNIGRRNPDDIAFISHFLFTAGKEKQNDVEDIN